MAQVVWTDEALANLDSIESYIRQFSPAAARRMMMRLMDAANNLVDFPARGRLTNGLLRELTVVRPYIIRYRFDGDVVTILRVRHGARRPD